MTDTTPEQISVARILETFAKLSDDDAAALLFCLEKGAKSKARGGMKRALNEFGRYCRARQSLPPVPPKPRAKRPKAT